MKKFLLLSTALSLCALPSLSYADEKDDRIAAMEAQMRVMMAEIENLKAERAADKQEQNALKYQVQTIDNKTTAITDTQESSSDDVQITMKSVTPKISKGDVSWQPFGRIHLDAASIQDDKVDHANGAEFRRARLGMKGTVAKDFGYKAEVDFANEQVALKEVYMNYTGVENTEFRIGHFKPAFALDELASSNDTVMIEPAAAVEPFITSEQLGIDITHHGSNYHANAGIYNDDAGVQSSDDEMMSLVGRAAIAPILNDTTAIHLGTSATYRKPDQANDRFDFDALAENRIQNTDSVSSVINDGESLTQYGLEAGLGYGPVSLQGEYVIANITNTGGQDPTYQGAYGQIGWMVTGEHRPYSIEKATFSGIKPTNPLDPSKGQYGALELAARYSHLDLNDSTLNGGQMDTITLGANWYLNDYMRLMGNYIITDTDDKAPTPDDDPQILLMRAQAAF